jgi:hypothetical protein
MQTPAIWVENPCHLAESRQIQPSLFPTLPFPYKKVKI